MQRIAMSLLVAGLMVAPLAAATDGPHLTLYHSANSSLFHSGQGSVDAGHAVIHEQRSIGLSKGTQDITLGNLPDYLDPEAVDLRFDSGRVHVLSQRLLLAQGRNDVLIGQIGKQVSVIGDNGQELVRGELVRVGKDGSLIIGGDVFGPTVVRRYSAVKLIAGETGSGSRLQVRLHSDTSGHADVDLTYPTRGLGWRAAYTATLQPGDSCKMNLVANASIANRSGRDWDHAQIKLVAGQPNFSASSGRPYPVMEMASAKQAMPSQDTLDAYRSFTLPDPVNLPDESVSVTPLYSPKIIDCQRSWTFENGRAWTPPRPVTNPSIDAAPQRGGIASILTFRAFDTMPAGGMRVLTTDKDGQVEFLGEDQVQDTSKDAEVSLHLGTAFDLHASSQRTAFNLDDANHRIDEAFQVTLSNSGDVARTVSVIEHPNRWNQWSLTSSSQPPDTQTTDTLTFKVAVPAHGKSTLDYAIRYQWTAADQH
jgi:hypothetical protein